MNFDPATTEQTLSGLSSAQAHLARISNLTFTLQHQSLLVQLFSVHRVKYGANLLPYYVGDTRTFPPTTRMVNPVDHRALLEAGESLRHLVMVICKQIVYIFLGTPSQNLVLRRNFMVAVTGQAGQTYERIVTAQLVAELLIMRV